MRYAKFKHALQKNDKHIFDSLRKVVTRTIANNQTRNDNSNGKKKKQNTLRIEMLIHNNTRSIKLQGQKSTSTYFCDFVTLMLSSSTYVCIFCFLYSFIFSFVFYIYYFLLLVLVYCFYCPLFFPMYLVNSVYCFNCSCCLLYYSPHSFIPFLSLLQARGYKNTYKL